MDKNQRKKLKQEYARLEKVVAKALRRFAPIDESYEYADIDDYESSVPKVVSMLVQNCTREELRDYLASVRVDEYELTANPERDWHIAGEVLHAVQGGARARRVKPQVVCALDLRKDVDAILAHFAARVRSFDPATNPGPGSSDEVQMIMIAFQHSQHAWVDLVFDTRPGDKNDGEWTLHLDLGRALDRADWLKADEAIERGLVRVVHLDGTESVLQQETGDLARPIGEMLKAVALQANADGAFAALPIAHGCEFYIEGFDTEYCWPEINEQDMPNQVKG